MARFFDIFPRLNRSQLDRDLARLRQERHNINVNANVNGSNNVNNLNSNIHNLNSTGRESSKIFSDLRIKMGAYLAITKSVADAVQGAIKTIKSFDDYTTDLANAMGEGREEAESYLATLNQQGKDLKATTAEMAEGADSFIRQGKSMAETETLIRNSMVLSKVAKMSSSESTDTLTSAMNSFNVSAEDTISIVDKLTSVDLVSASSADGLAVSMGKSAGAAKLAGIEIDKLISMLAVMKEANPMESDETVGNAMKSILSRMNQVKAGAYVDSETGEALNQVETVLGEVGIAMRDVNGQFISSENILDEVGQKWSSFDSVTQRAVGTVMAGTYQYSRFLNLMDGYSKVLEYTTVAQNSSGQAMEKFQNYEESLEAKTKLLQNSLESLAYDTFGNSFYGSVLDATTGLVQFAEKTEALKEGLTVLGIVGGAKLFTAIATSIVGAVKNLSNFNSALSIIKNGSATASFGTLLACTESLNASQLKLILSSQALTNQQRVAIMVRRGYTEEEIAATLATINLASAEGTATGATATLTGAVKGLGASFKMFIAENPLLAALSAIGLAIYGTVKVYDALTLSVEEANEAMNEAVSSYKSTKSELESINTELEENQKQIDELKAKDKLTYVERGQLEELQEITKELQLQQDITERKAEKESRDVAEKTVDAYDTQYGKFDINEDEVNKRLDEMNLADVTSITASDNDITGNIAELLNYQKLLDETAQKSSKTDLSAEDEEWLEEDFQDYTDHIQELNDILDTNLSDLEEKRQNLEESYNAAIEKQLSGKTLTTKEKDVISTYENIASVMKLIYQYIDPNGWNSIQISSVFDTKDIEVTKEELIEMAKAGELDENTIKGYINLNNAINDMDLIGDTSAMQAFVEEIYASVDATEDATTSAGTLSKTFADTLNSEDYAEVKEELLELAKAGELTTATLTSTEDYKKLLSETGMLAGDAKDRILDMLSAQEKLSAASQGLDKLKNAYEEFKDEDIGFVTAETLSSLPDAFKELKGFDLFSQIVGDPTSGTKKIQQAFDDIVKEYLVEQRTLTGLSRENMNSYIANLKQMGITNAEEVTNMVLTNLEAENSMIEQAEKEYIQCLNDGTAADLDHVQTVMGYNQKLASALGSSYQKDYETWCKLLELKSKAYNEFVERIGGSYNSELNTIQNMMANGKDMSTSNIADALAAEAKLRDAEYEVQKQSEILKIDMTKIDTNFGGGYSPKTSSDDKKNGDASSKTIDWIEILLDKASKATEKLKEKFEEAFSLTKAKKAFSKAINQITKEIKANEKAAAYYEKKANSVKLSSKYKKLVDNGALKIEDITDEALAEQIEAYQDYKDKADACRETIDDLRDSYEELAETFYNKPLELRDDALEDIDTKLQLLDSKIENASTPSERSKYADEKETLYKNEYSAYETAESTAKSNLSTAKAAIDKKSDKALKGLTTAQKKKITGAVAKGMEITDDMIDFDSLTEDALSAVTKYNESLKAYGEAVADRKQAEQDLQSNLRENMQVKIDNKSNYIDMLEAKYENIDENDWKSRNSNLDKQIKKTKEMYELMIEQETDVYEKERLRAEMNKQIADLTEQQVENIRTYWQNVGDLADARKNELSSQEDYYEASGLDNKSTRLDELANTSMQSKIAAKAKLEEANTYEKDSKEYASAISDYWKLMAEFSNAEYEMWREGVINGIDETLDAVNRKIEKFTNELDLDEAKGIVKDETDYATLINAENESIDKNKTKISKLKARQQQLLNNGGTTDSAQYNELQSEIEECEDAIYSSEKAQIEYNNAVAQLPIDRLEKELELLDAIGEHIEANNDLRQKKGEDLSVEDYQAELNNIKQKEANAKSNANIAYVNMLKALSNPERVYGGKTAEEWQTDFENAQTAAINYESEWIDVKNEMRDDVFWRDIERKMDTLQHKSDMLTNIGDLISDEMKFDSDGNLTDLGVASLANDVALLENAQEQVKGFQEEIQILNEHKDDYTDDEFNEKMKELQNNLLGATKDTMSYTDAIIDMAKAMAENELDALNKIIDKRKKALKEKMAYYDYDKNLRNQNKSIAALEAEIAAMEGLTDATTKAELARKQAELEELKEARDDTIIEHNYEIQSNGLDELSEDLQTKYDDYIDNIGTNFESINGIVENAKGVFAKSFNSISQTMYNLLQSYGIDPNTTGINWTPIADTTQGFATGGIIRSNYTGQDDKILVRVNPDETILTKKFTDMLPSAVEAMQNMNMFQPVVSPMPLLSVPVNNSTGNSTTNIDTLIRVDGNVDKTVVGDLKELANDLAKKTNLLDKSYQYTTSNMVKDAKSMGIKRTF